MAMSSTQPVYFGYTGMIEPGGVGRIAGALNSAVNSGVETVHLAFSSNGGYVADGIYLHNHIRALPLHVVIYNTGSVSSIADEPRSGSLRYRVVCGAFIRSSRGARRPRDRSSISGC